MQKTIVTLKAIALASVAALCFAGAVLATQLSEAVQDFRADQLSIVRHVDALLGEAQRPIVLSGKLINDGRLTLDNVNKAAIDERFYFEKEMPSAMVQAHAVLGNVQQATADLHPLLQTATARVQDLQPVEAQATQLIADVDATARDPHITASLQNLETSSKQLIVLGEEGVAIGGSVKAIAADGQAEVHSLTHPKPIITIANWTLKGLSALRAWF